MCRRQAVGWAARTCAFAETTHRNLAVAHGADDDGRHLGVDKEDLTGKLDDLVEKGIGLCGAHAARCEARDGECGNGGAPDHAEGAPEVISYGSHASSKEKIS
jgi:hypothetical protein